MGHNHAKIENFCCIFANCMVKVIKNRVLRLLALASGLIFSTIVPISAQDLPLLPEDAAVCRTVMPDGLSCYVADNPYVKGFADYVLVCKASGKILLDLHDVPTVNESVTDSTLIEIMNKVEALGTPSGLAVIACGDLRSYEVLKKLRYMSYMIPASAEVPGLEFSYNGQTPVSFTTYSDTTKGLATVFAGWTSSRTPVSMVGTVQTAVYDKTVHELGTVICTRVRKTLHDKNIPVADVNFKHVGSLDSMSDETFSFEVTVRDSSVLEAEKALKQAFASVDSYGASSSELVVAENVYFKEQDALRLGFDRTNAAYIQMCVRAFLMGTPLASSAQSLGYLKSKDVSPKNREQIFYGISSALLGLPHVEAASDSKVYFNASDTMAFPSIGPKVMLRLFRKEPISGGVVWTFSNGFKVVYKKMPTAGVLHYALAMNGGYAGIRDLAKGEGAFVSDYLDLCNIAGMKSRDFKKVLLLSGITMDTHVNLSNVMVSGEVRDANASLLMRALLAVANERTPDEEAMAYHLECERLRLLHAPVDLKAVTDALMCPDYKYSSYKSVENLPKDLASKAESLFAEITSKMNDGVLVLVGDMSESAIRKAIMPYVGGFRTDETASRKTSVRYQPMSGSMTYDVEGDSDVIFVNMSARLPMTTENYMAAEMAVMVLKDILSEELEPYGVKLQLDYTRRIYPEERFNVMLNVSAPDGVQIPQEVLNVFRYTLSGAAGSDVDADYFSACKVYMKHKYVMQMQEPTYWLQAVAMRYLDGKDYTTGYASKIDEVSVEDVRKIMRLLEKGNNIEYIINRK